MTVLSRSKKAAVRDWALAGVDDVCWSAAESDDGHSAQHRAVDRQIATLSPKWQFRQRGAVTAIFLVSTGACCSKTTLAPRAHCRVYSEHHSAYAGVYQPDPPGLIHDDLRLLPPWRGSSLFGTFRWPNSWAFSIANRRPSGRSLCTDRTLVHRFAVARLAALSPAPARWATAHGDAPTSADSGRACRCRAARRSGSRRRGRRRAGRPRGATPLSRKVWSAASAVVLDEAAAQRVRQRRCRGARTSSW